MSAPRVLVTTSSFGAGDARPLELIRAHGLEPVLNPHGRKLTEDEALSLITEVGPVGMVAGVEPLTARVLEAAGGLRVVSRCGIGLDSVDTAAADRLGIRVLNTPDAPTDAVAELTVGLMLSVLRRVAEADRNVRAGRWKALMGRLLGAQTVGVLGCGRIGRRVGGLCRAFGSEVLGCDPAVGEAPGFRMTGLEELLGASDVVTLHIPYSDSTRRFMDAGRLGAMKPGAVLVNTSRGGLVDEEALHALIASGHLGGAGLDTFESEPYDGPLKGLGQVVMTAHMGSYAVEARARMEMEAARNLVDALEEAGAAPGAATGGET